MDLDEYPSPGFYDELVLENGEPRESSKLLFETVDFLGIETLLMRQKAAERGMRSMGITFRVYGETTDLERTIPFDILPRIMPGAEWDNVDKGLKQRIRALNAFIHDVYNGQEIFKQKVLPEWILSESKGYLPQCKGIEPPGKIWAHVCGTDLVRDDKGKIYVLEDNLRVPSGASYVLLNRELMKRNFPEVFRRSRVRPVMDYPLHFKQVLHSLMPHLEKPSVAVLTPGIYNSAYFEHSFLAQKLGAYLVEGRDLVYDGKYLCMRTTRGLKRIDILYRRVDDQFLDPEVFRPDSILGCPGIMKAWLKGTLAIANAPGTGVADDKVVYSFVPDMIRYYLQEEPILANVPTQLCREPEQLQYTLDHLSELVVKPANESGGYGMIVGPMATKEEREKFAQVLKENPSNYIAQPTLSLSTTPTLIEGELEPRHIDLRPFVLMGQGKISVLPGGLTRVALRKGSLVVNSSQGGGTKDTWIVD